MFTVKVNGETVKATLFSNIDDLINEFTTGHVMAQSKNMDTGNITIRQEIRGKFGWETQTITIEAL